MSTAAVLPHLNAALNAISAILLIIGFILIRAGRRDVHRKVMIAALSVSAVFLVSYLTYHFTAPIFVFQGTGWTRPVYYALLISHVILATLATPLVAVTAYRALKGTFDRHRAIARWTIGVWLYVAVSGVMIYVALYHIYPTPPSSSLARSTNALSSSLARRAEDPGVSRICFFREIPNTSASLRFAVRTDDTESVT
ncbi:MAG: DUF420 domain-containing protein [Rhodospirillaceae bacterium]